jgi:hypothetical protein
MSAVRGGSAEDAKAEAVRDRPGEDGGGVVVESSAASAVSRSHH